MLTWHSQQGTRLLNQCWSGLWFQFSLEATFCYLLKLFNTARCTSDFIVKTRVKDLFTFSVVIKQILKTPKKFTVYLSMYFCILTRTLGPDDGSLNMETYYNPCKALTRIILYTNNLSQTQKCYSHYSTSLACHYSVFFSHMGLMETTVFW